MRLGWSNVYPPDDHFYTLESAIQTINLTVGRAETEAPSPDPMPVLYREVRRAVDEMEEDYEPQSSTSVPVATSPERSSSQPFSRCGRIS